MSTHEELIKEPSYRKWLTIVEQDGMALEGIPQALKTSELCLIAVKQAPYAIFDVPQELRTPEMYLITRFLFSCPIPKEFLPINLTWSLKEYEAKLLEGKTKEELLTHPHPWFRAKGEKSV